MRTGFALGIVLALASPTVAWAAEPINPPEPSAALPESTPDDIALFADEGRRMKIDVIINGKGPFPFIVDTGAEETLIARELVTQLALREGPEKRLHSLGVSRTVRTAIVAHLAANKMVVKDIVAPAVNRYNLGAAGILGLPALKSQRMLLDFKAGTMALTPSNVRQENWEGESITVTARNRLGQLILADASIEGDRVQVIIDTGNELSVGNEPLRRLLSARRSGPSSANLPVSLMDVNGDTTSVDSMIVDKLRIATFGFNHVPIAFADAHIFTVLGLKRTPTLLLGMDVLKLFGRVSIDFGNRRVRFQTAEAYNVPTAAAATTRP